MLLWLRFASKPDRLAGASTWGCWIGATPCSRSFPCHFCRSSLSLLPAIRDVRTLLCLSGDIQHLKYVECGQRRFERIVEHASTHNLSLLSSLNGKNSRKREQHALIASREAACEALPFAKPPRLHLWHVQVRCASTNHVSKETSMLSQSSTFRIADDCGRGGSLF